jgi:hypothetical protein
MRHRPKRRASLPHTSARPRSLLVASGLLSALQARSETTATNPGDEALWRAETVFQVVVRSDYGDTPGHVTRLDAILATTHLRFSSPARPCIAGLMIEYRLIHQRADTLLVAGMFTYKTPKWAAATVSETLSVSVAAGSGFDAGTDAVARTSVTWRHRPGGR